MIEITKVTGGTLMYNGDVLWNVCDMEVATEVEPSSLTKEKFSLTHEATFNLDLKCDSPIPLYVDSLNSKASYITYSVPIMIQARWHKKKRINKKWLKRYGMKKDTVLVKCDVESIDAHPDPIITKTAEWDFTLTNMQYKFRLDQLRKNIKIEI